MELKVIAVTGGPCAGKTTALAWINEAFSKLGWKVVIAPESATELILAGMKPEAFREFYGFEQAILKMMIARENEYLGAVKNLAAEKVLLVFDRGLLDVGSFMDPSEFTRLLEEVGLTEVEIWNRYDGVFHLVTAAIGAEEFYTLENNAARRETKAEAAQNDKEVRQVWTGHSHFRIIDNSTGFEEKMRRLIKEIACLLGEPEPYEIERKFLIKYPNLHWLENEPNCRKVEICQTYLCSDGDDEVRIRQRGVNGDYQYSLTTKRKVDRVTRIEKEQRISAKEYLQRMMAADTRRRPLRKTRYCLVYESQYFEIDVYEGVKEWAILEIELNNIGQGFTLPPNIDVIREVTGSARFDNSNLAKFDLERASVRDLLVMEMG